MVTEIIVELLPTQFAILMEMLQEKKVATAEKYTDRTLEATGDWRKIYKNKSTDFSFWLHTERKQRKSLQTSLFFRYIL